MRRYRRCKNWASRLNSNDNQPDEQRRGNAVPPPLFFANLFSWDYRSSISRRMLRWVGVVSTA
jgi:hypothetical protein